MIKWIYNENPKQNNEGYNQDIPRIPKEKRNVIEYMDVSCHKLPYGVIPQQNTSQGIFCYKDLLYKLYSY